MPEDNQKQSESTPPVPGAIFAGLLVLATAAVLALLSFLRFIPEFLIASKPPTVAPVVPAIDTSALLMGGILIMLIGIFVLLAIAIFCCCGCTRGGPSLPRLPKIAGVLNSVAAVLDQGADGISTANALVDPARQALIGLAGITVPVPKFTSLGNFDLGPVFNGEVWVPDGVEHKSLIDLIDDTTEQQLEEFANDATGKTVLDNASTTLRQQADTLEGQADLLESVGL